jgi:hypothetical protein
MDAQSVMAISGTGSLDGFTGEDGNDLLNPSASSRAGYGSNYTASGSDLEDMINDILTY